MTFTVLGASGSIGSLLRKHLEGTGAEVYAPGRDDPEIFARPLGRVLYCIGRTGDFRTRPLETVEAHVGLLGRLLERSEFESLLYLSSTRVYRGLEAGIEDARLLLHPGDPDDLYNASKLCGEALCLTSQRGETRVARLSNVVGPGARSPSFARSLVEAALVQAEIRLETHPESRKDYVDIRDVVELLPRLTSGHARIYNVASGRETTHRELAKELALITDARVAWDENAAAASFPPVSIQRVLNEFDFSPRPLRESLQDMVAAESRTGG
jgi:nucleoside-diphosphate-sugar epimerase